MSTRRSLPAIEQWILPWEIEEVWVVWPDYQLWSAHGRSPDSGAPYHNVVTSILLDGVTKHHGSTVALANLTLRVEDGEAVVLVGPTGSGKTSILRLIAGLDEPSEGDILIDGTPREEGEVTDVAMFFAETLLYPKMTGRENVAFPLTVKKVAEPERSHRVDAEAAVLGITRILERKPGHMSAGQRQLIQLAKAMVRGPSLFLVDEPLSSIDGPSRAIIRRELRKVQSGYGATAVYATHDQDDAMTLADRLVVLDSGRVRQVGPPSNVYREPVDRFVATFLGTPEMGIFPATRTARGVRVESLELTTPGVVPERVQVGVRPEDWVPGDRGVDAKVLKVTALESPASNCGHGRSDHPDTTHRTRPGSDVDHAPKPISRVRRGHRPDGASSPVVGPRARVPHENCFVAADPTCLVQPLGGAPGSPTFRTEIDARLLRDRGRGLV